MASSMNDLRGNVVDGIADMLINMPQNPIRDQSKFGEVDLQTRFYHPLLASILADATKKVMLRWPNKMDETVPQIRTDAIVSSVVQLKLGPSLGYGEVKPGDDTTTNQSLCIDTMKLAVLSRNAAQMVRFNTEEDFCGKRTLNRKFCGARNWLPFTYHVRDWPTYCTRLFGITSFIHHAQ